MEQIIKERIDAIKKEIKKTGELSQKAFKLAGELEALEWTLELLEKRESK